MKNSALLFLLSICLFYSCDNFFTETEDSINTEEVESQDVRIPITLKIRSVNSSSLDEAVEITVTDPNGRIFSLDGSKPVRFASKDGIVPLILVTDKIPSIQNPYRFSVNVENNKYYFDNFQEISITNANIEFHNIYMFSLSTNPQQNDFVYQKSNLPLSNEYFSGDFNQLFNRKDFGNELYPSDSSGLEQIRFSNPIIYDDIQDRPLGIEELPTQFNYSFSYFDLQNKNLNATFPGSYQVHNARDLDGRSLTEDGPIYLRAFGWFKNEANVSNDNLLRIEGITHRISISKDTYNPSTKKRIQAGDEVTLWILRSDPTPNTEVGIENTWVQHSNYIIQQSEQEEEEDMYVDVQTSTMATYAAVVGPAIGTCNNISIQVEVKNDIGFRRTFSYKFFDANACPLSAGQCLTPYETNTLTVEGGTDGMITFDNPPVADLVLHIYDSGSNAFLEKSGIIKNDVCQNGSVETVVIPFISSNQCVKFKVVLKLRPDDVREDLCNTVLWYKKHLTTDWQHAGWFYQGEVNTTALSRGVYKMKIRYSNSGYTEFSFNNNSSGALSVSGLNDDDEVEVTASTSSTICRDINIELTMDPVPYAQCL